MPIRSFGLFAATIIIVNYGIFVLYFPAILVFWEKKIKNTKWACKFEKGLKIGHKIEMCKK